MKTLEEYMAKLPDRFDESSVRRLVEIILEDAREDRYEAYDDGYRDGYRDGCEENEQN